MKRVTYRIDKLLLIVAEFVLGLVDNLSYSVSVYVKRAQHVCQQARMRDGVSSFEDTPVACLERRQ